MNYFVEIPEYRQLYVFAGEPVEFVYRTYVERASTEFLEHIREMLAEEGVQPSQFKGRIVYMSMYNDINWWQNKKENVCRPHAIHVASFTREFEP